MTSTASSASAPHSPADLPIIVKDRRRRGFFTIDNALLDRYGTELKPAGIAVYNGLARYTNREGECWPSQTSLAKLVGMSRMQVSREIDKLKRLGLIEVQPQYNQNGGQRANLYILLNVSDEEEAVTHRYTPCNHELHPPVTESDTPCNNQVHEQHPENKTQAEQNTEKQPVVVALVDQGISERVAQRLAKSYSKAHIEEKIAYLAYLKTERPESVQKPCGWLRKAIEEDYMAPDGYKSAEEQAAEIVEAQQIAHEQLQQEEAERERRQQEEANRLTHLYTTYGTTQQEIDLWNPLLEEFKLSMPAASFVSYVADTMLLSLKGGEALVGLPNARARDWLENRFATKIRRALSSCLGGQTVNVKFVDLSATHEDNRTAAAG